MSLSHAHPSVSRQQQPSNWSAPCWSMVSDIDHYSTSAMSAADTTSCLLLLVLDTRFSQLLS